MGKKGVFDSTRTLPEALPHVSWVAATNIPRKEEESRGYNESEPTESCPGETHQCSTKVLSLVELVRGLVCVDSFLA